MASGDVVNTTARLQSATPVDAILSRPDAAHAWLRPGREETVERSLAFFRSVGATDYIAEAEGLLSASA